MAQAIGKLHKLRQQENFPTQDLAKAIRTDPGLYESLMESLRAALVAQGLAEQANLVNPEGAYLLGLFSNLGRLWLAAHYRGELARATERRTNSISRKGACVGFSTRLWSC